MTDISSTAIDAVHSLAREASALTRDNRKLAEGVAAQAGIIRELHEEVSRLQAALDIQTYNVEFLKVQARRTRLKLRSAKRGQKQALAMLGEAAQQVQDERSHSLYREQAIGKLRIDNSQLRIAVTNRELELASLKATIIRTSPLHQQRQTYGVNGVIVGKRTSLIVADDIEPDF